MKRTESLALCMVLTLLFTTAHVAKTYAAPHQQTAGPTDAVLRFPFDTIFSGLVERAWNNGEDSIVIARYGIKLRFGSSTSLVCCPELSTFDFIPQDIRFPSDPTTLVSWTSYPPVSLDGSYETHEYRLPPGNTTGQVLYMKVLGGTPDTMVMRFDTVSFLSARTMRTRSAIADYRKISLALDKNFIVVDNVDNGEIAIYDVAGKRLFSSIFSSKTARVSLPTLSAARVFIVKVRTGHGLLVVKKCIVN